MAISLVIILVYSETFLISPWKLLRLVVAIVFFESYKGCGVVNIAFGLVAPEYRGGCADLKGLGGSGYQGSVSIVVKKEGDEWPERWEALLNNSN